jgi:hypothetical protein
MAYLLSKPDDWQVRMEDLLGHGPCGLSAMRRIVRELEGRGFLRRVRGRTQDGRFQWFTEVWESPLPCGGAGVVSKGRQRWSQRPQRGRLAGWGAMRIYYSAEIGRWIGGRRCVRRR